MTRDDDIEQWLEALAGRSRDATRQAPEVAAIRSVLQRDIPTSSDADAPSTADDPCYTALMERLQREGLIDADTARSAPSLAKRRPRRKPWSGRLARPVWTAGLALAATLILVLLIPAFIGGPDSPAWVAHRSANYDRAPRMRGGPSQRQRTPVSRERIAKLLPRVQAAGLPYRLRETDSAWWFDFHVPDTSRAVASEWLQADAIPIPASGWVRLETPKTVD